MENKLAGVRSNVKFGEGGSLTQSKPPVDAQQPVGTQPKCKHPSDKVVADILEGDGVLVDVVIQWCRGCGAIRRVNAAGTSFSVWRVVNG